MGACRSGRARELGALTPAEIDQVETIYGDAFEQRGLGEPSG